MSWDTVAKMEFGKVVETKVGHIVASITFICSPVYFMAFQMDCFPYP